jgi:hypothetical protein
LLLEFCFTITEGAAYRQSPRVDTVRSHEGVFFFIRFGLWWFSAANLLNLIGGDAIFNYCLSLVDETSCCCYPVKFNWVRGFVVASNLDYLTNVSLAVLKALTSQRTAVSHIYDVDVLIDNHNYKRTTP